MSDKMSRQPCRLPVSVQGGQEHSPLTFNSKRWDPMDQSYRLSMNREKMRGSRWERCLGIVYDLQQVSTWALIWPSRGCCFVGGFFCLTRQSCGLLCQTAYTFLSVKYIFTDKNIVFIQVFCHLGVPFKITYRSETHIFSYSCDTEAENSTLYDQVSV